MSVKKKLIVVLLIVNSNVLVAQNTKWRFKYDLVQEVKNNESIMTNVVKVKNGDYYGLFDIDGKELIPIKYDNITDFTDGIAKMTLKNKKGLINAQGKIISDCYWDQLDGPPFKGGLVIARIHKQSTYNKEKKKYEENKGFYGYLDTNGVRVIDCSNFDEITYFHNGFAEVKLYDSRRSSLNNMLLGIDNSKKGFINTKGEKITEIKYEQLMQFEDGFAGVKLNNRWGFINTKGEKITEIKYDNLLRFYDGFAVVSLNDRWGFINSNGENITEIKYDSMMPFDSGFAGVSLNGRWGFINSKGEEIVAPKYDKIGDFKDGFWTVFEYFRNDYIGIGYLNTKGEFFKSKPN